LPNLLSLSKLIPWFLPEQNISKAAGGKLRR
jgi:hypothetical protein